ncbi:MAG: hypothetical protein SPF22_07280 [Candidatus Onthovivens sp.]|nr:hypothetical protein [Candidatus Onthovivens sp.]
MLREYFEETGSLFEAIVLSIIEVVLTLLFIAAPIGIFIWLLYQPWFMNFINTHFV